MDSFFKVGRVGDEELYIDLNQCSCAPFVTCRLKPKDCWLGLSLDSRDTAAVQLSSLPDLVCSGRAVTTSQLLLGPLFLPVWVESALTLFLRLSARVFILQQHLDWKYGEGLSLTSFAAARAGPNLAHVG